MEQAGSTLVASVINISSLILEPKWLINNPIDPLPINVSTRNQPHQRLVLFERNIYLVSAEPVTKERRDVTEWKLPFI